MFHGPFATIGDLPVIPRLDIPFPDFLFQFSDWNKFAKEEETMNLILIGGIGV